MYEKEEDEGTVGRFSMKRWGPGSLILVGVSFSLGSALLLEWASSHSTWLLAVSSMFFMIGSVVFVVKIFEEIHPYRQRRGLLGAEGVVVREINGATAGVVKVDGELWSAYSDQTLGAGDRVIVVRAEGVRVWVEKPPDGGDMVQPTNSREGDSSDATGGQNPERVQ